MPHLTSLDHLVLTVADIETTVAFYCGVLGMRREDFTPPDDSQRTALKFGTQKINLHAQTRPFDPKAHSPTAGSADMCFLTDMPLTDWTAHLATHNIHIEQGPVARTGATGPILSIYLRDPDGNLVEIAQPQ